MKPIAVTMVVKLHEMFDYQLFFWFGNEQRTYGTFHWFNSHELFETWLPRVSYVLGIHSFRPVEMVETKRFMRISLRMMLIVVFCCAVIGWVVRKRILSLREAEAARAIVELYETRNNSVRNTIFFEYDRYVDRVYHPIKYDSGPCGNRQREISGILVWLRRTVGKDCFHRVVEVHLAHREVGDEDLEHLRYFPGLMSLNLDDTSVTDKGLQKLVHLDQLERLCLGETRITNDGLADLRFFKNLKELELWHNDITDDGIVHLRHLSQLKRINLCFTRVTWGGVNRLQDALPECQIWWDGNKSFRLINECPKPLGGNKHGTDPAALVRVVNHLHSLGKQQAVEALREYTRIAPGEQLNEYVPYCQTRLCLIMPVLFQRVDPKQGIPIRHCQDFDVSREVLKALGITPPLPNTDAQDWPMSYVTVEGDIPFHDMRFVLHRPGVSYPSRRYLVDWTEKACRLRANPLVPVDDPLAAASSLLTRLKTEYDELSDPHIDSLNEEYITRQAKRMVSHLFVEPQTKFRWNKNRQRYELMRVLYVE